MRELVLDYIAGFVDGEGSIRIEIKKACWSKGSSFGYFFAPHIDCSQRDRMILDLIKEKLGMGRVSKMRHGFIWIISSRQACINFINLMKERVVLKRPHLELLLYFFSLRRPYEVYSKEICMEVLSIIEKLCHLNSKHSERTLERVKVIREEVQRSSYKPEDRGRKIAEKMRGKRPSEEARRRMSIAAKARGARERNQRARHF